MMHRYLTAVFAITSSKMIMNEKRLPFFLCVVQFSCASIITYYAKYYFPFLIPNHSTTSHSNPNSNSNSQSQQSNNKYNKSDKTQSQQASRNHISPIKSYNDSSVPFIKKKPGILQFFMIPEYDMYIYQIAISYTLGFIFTNIAFSVGKSCKNKHNYDGVIYIIFGIVMVIVSVYIYIYHLFVERKFPKQCKKNYCTY